MSLDIVAMSDLHGHLPSLPAGDLLLLAGDLLPDDHQEEWTEEQLVPWMKGFQGDVVTVAGNHDWFFEKIGPDAVSRILPGHYLLDSGVEIEGLRIWGTPWVRDFPGWAFAASYEKQRERFALVPEDTDILLSHTPPSGILDTFGGESCGSVALAASLQRVRAQLSVFGHIHERAGERIQIGSTLFMNVSVVDGQGAPVAPQKVQAHPQGDVP